MFHIPAHYAAAALRQLEMPQTDSGHMITVLTVCLFSFCACVSVHLCKSRVKYVLCLYISVL